MLHKKNIRILVADRSELMQKYIRRILQDDGYPNVVTADTGLEVIDQLKASHVDCIVCCWDLPKIKGIDILRNLRGMNRTRNIPFIMVTAKGGAEFLAQARKLGVSAYVTKPFTPDTFKKAFISALVRHGHITRAD